MSRSILLRAALMLLFGCSLPVFAEPADSLERTLLWRIDRPGDRGSSYVYGTMHVSRKVAFHLTDSFFTALKGADVVALELDPSHWLQEFTELPLMELGYLYAGGGEQAFYSEAFPSEVPGLEKLVAALGETPRMVDQLLYRFTEGYEGREERTFLDLFIHQAARKLGKPVVGLERFDEVLAMLMEAELPPNEEEQRALQASAPLLERRDLYERYGDPNTALEEAYRRGDLERMNDLYDLMNPGPRHRRFMLDERNLLMAARLDTLVATRRAFVGVGAMHLPGDRGLIALLRERGFTVTPVVGTVDRRSMAEREKIEERYLPPVLERRPVLDGAYTMELPGPMVALQIPGQTERMEIVTDPVNGAFAVAVSMPHHARLRGRTLDQEADRLDSLLYECMPGRIQERRRTRTAEGHPLFLLSAVTERGDRHQARIEVTPFELVVMSAAGRNTSVVRKDLERMVGSVRRTPPAGEGPLAPEWSVCSIPFPRERVVTRPDGSYQLAGTRALTRDLLAQGQEADGTYRLLRSASYHDLGYLEEDTFELHRLAEAFLEPFDLEPGPFQEVRHQDRPGSWTGLVNAAGDSLQLFTTLHGPYYHLLLSSGSRTEARSWVAGLRFREPLEAPVEKPYVDSLIHFQARVRTWMSDLQQRSPAFARMLWKAMRHMSEEELERLDLTWDQSYGSLAGPALITVEYQRHDPFAAAMGPAERVEDRLRSYADDIGAELEQVQVREEGDRAVGEGLLSVPACSRAIAVWMEARPGSQHLLAHVADTLDLLPAFHQAFRDGLVPVADTVVVCCDDPTDLFFQALTGSDKDLRERALEAVVHVPLEERHLETLRGVMRSPLFDTLSSDQRRAFLQRLAAVPTTGERDLVRERYAASSDSISLQLALLRGLAEQHRTEATALFLELLLADAPLVQQGYLLNRAFSPFLDSMPTARPLFPGSLELLRYPEYADPLYRLLARAVDDQLIAAPELATWRDRIVSDLRSELKRTEGAFDDDDWYGGAFGSYTRGHDDLSDRVDRVLGTGTEEYSGITLNTSTVYALLRLSVLWRDLPEVQAAHAKALGSADLDLALYTALLREMSGMPVDPAVWERLSTSPGRRLPLYLGLERIGRLDLFPRHLLDEDEVALSYLVTGTDLTADSVEVIGDRWVSCRVGQGRVRFYRHLSEGRYELACVGFLPQEPGSATYADIGFYESSQETYLEEELDEAIDLMVRRIRDAGRQRTLREP